jgi:hypothetical protein
MKTVLNTICGMLLLVALVLIAYGYVANSVGNAMGKLDFGISAHADTVHPICRHRECTGVPPCDAKCQALKSLPYADRCDLHACKGE